MRKLEVEAAEQMQRLDDRAKEERLRQIAMIEQAYQVGLRVSPFASAIESPGIHAPFHRWAAFAHRFPCTMPLARLVQCDPLAHAHTALRRPHPAPT